MFVAAFEMEANLQNNLIVQRLKKNYENFARLRIELLKIIGNKGAFKPALFFRGSLKLR